MNFTDGKREEQAGWRPDGLAASSIRNQQRRTYDRLRKASLRLRDKRLKEWSELGTYRTTWTYPGVASYAKIYTAHQAYVLGVREALDAD